MNQNEQMLREALQAIEAVLEDAYHRHFAECCGRGQGGCCGDFIEQWTPEDHKILDTLSPIQRKLSQALAAEPAPTVKKTTQNWAGMDGATAWQLIDRHAESWEETAKMMHEWLEANTPEPAPPELVPPLNCRQRLQAEGKPYPRSSCAACGVFSPNFKQCDAQLSGSSKHVEPAPLVRLTGKEQLKLARLAQVPGLSHNQAYLQCVLATEEAVIAKNGGK